MKKFDGCHLFCVIQFNAEIYYTVFMRPKSHTATILQTQCGHSADLDSKLVWYKSHFNPMKWRFVFDLSLSLFYQCYNKTVYFNGYFRRRRG